MGRPAGYTSGCGGERSKNWSYAAQLLTVNTDGGPSLLPLRIEKTRGEWHPTPKVEFYVDFEFCSDLNDDFSKLPEKGGQPLIFFAPIHRPTGSSSLIWMFVGKYRQARP